MENKRAILVTGSHRSGTSWFGEMLSLSPEIGSIWEPFNMYHRAGICRSKFDVWYPYVAQHNGVLHKNALQDCMSFKYSLGAEIPTIKTFYDLARMGKDLLRFEYLRLSNKRPLLKDPIAFFSAEWLAETFDMQVAVLVRHPAAFVSSLKIKDWQYPFEHFLKQPHLIEAKLSSFRDEINSFVREPRDIIDQACLLWRMIYTVAHEYEQKHPDWLVLRHETISLDPEVGFASVYDFLQMEYTDAIKANIQKFTGAQNPGERVRARSVQRNSRENIFNWKKRLTADEIERVFGDTQRVASHWYTAADW
ncbi:MAG: sulfotransferase [Saprospiraceae bacterium]|nr:sulfotransferase [Saprospiraceae bacterium]